MLCGYQEVPLNTPGPDGLTENNLATEIKSTEQFKPTIEDS